MRRGIVAAVVLGTCAPAVAQISAANAKSIDDYMQCVQLSATKFAATRETADIVAIGAVEECSELEPTMKAAFLVDAKSNNVGPNLAETSWRQDVLPARRESARRAAIYWVLRARLPKLSKP